MTDEYTAGRIGPRPLIRVAENAAAHLVSQSEDLAVCLSPDATVTVERPDEAVEDDLVGVYRPSSGMLEAYRSIRDDLKAAVAERGIATPPPANPIKVQPSVSKARMESALGCIPVPATRLRTAPPPRRRDAPETVAEFQARGGRVERIAGFESVRPHSLRPMGKAA